MGTRKKCKSTAFVLLQQTTHHPQIRYNQSISVSDHGQGFDPDILNNPIKKTGFGLISIRERASYIGGSMIIDSTLGKGSRFTLTVPLNIGKYNESLSVDSMRTFNAYRQNGCTQKKAHHFSMVRF